MQTIQIFNQVTMSHTRRHVKQISCINRGCRQ